jgi:hypothetical protein
MKIKQPKLAIRFLFSALVGGEWSASCPSCFTPSERAPSTHWIGGCAAPELVWTTWKSENSCLHWDSWSLSHPAHKAVAILTVLSQLFNWKEMVVINTSAPQKHYCHRTAKKITLKTLSLSNNFQTSETISISGTITVTWHFKRRFLIIPKNSFPFPPLPQQYCEQLFLFLTCNSLQ